jgi:radical SAM superfamily enzyme YgiQ (UPF0313 family)
MSLQPSLGPIRPPSEAYSLLLRVTKNCPYNRCEFCSVFKGQKFERRTVEEIKEEILMAKATEYEVERWAEELGHDPAEIARVNGILWLQEGCVKSVFLQDSDSLVIKTDMLVEVLEFLRETFPTVEKVCTYARGHTLFRKKPEDLLRLREAGLTRLHIGLETGDDELLHYVKKGATSEQMIEAGRKAVAAGFEVSEYVMPGLGGREKWRQHALNSARVLNAIDPHFIRLRTFHLIAGSTIFEKAERGEFHMQSIEGVLLEIRSFIEALEVNSELVSSDYAHNFFMGEIDGKLPEDKDKLLRGVDEALAEWRSRGEPRRNPFMGILNRTLD